MNEKYDHLEVEPRISKLWEISADFSPQIVPGTRPFSMFLNPPNASGPMHIGNILMISIQDILARFHRAQGRPTLWIPSMDHGGYETQILFEKELEAQSVDKSTYRNQELFEMINQFAQRNIGLISEQIKSLGASVDWSRLRFTIDEEGVRSAINTFKKMVSDNLIYRRPYMVHYCHTCGTILSDIELKEQQNKCILYYIKFPFTDNEGELILQTSHPEFLFATTHVLVHPQDREYARHIGRQLINPSTGNTVEIIASKRKFDPTNPSPLKPLNSSFDKYDYGYTLRNNIPSRNLLDWDGRMIEHHPGLTPLEARSIEVEKLYNKGSIEKVEEGHMESTYLCKRDHATANLILETWFLKLDDEKISLKQNALEAMNKERPLIIPGWREKGLIEWISKMPDWPIARQNVWGIRIPVWYEITDPSKFRVWFIDHKGEKHFGPLNSFLENGYGLEEIEKGLERIYVESGVPWTLDKEIGRAYLPETDTFDTWFSSGQWATNVYMSTTHPKDHQYFYPSDSIIAGHDLLRLWVARVIMLSQYLSGRLPFRLVYLNRLIKGADGQKMSKSLGNAVTLESYIENYGADTTRMSLISYTNESEDFIVEKERLEFFRNFCDRLWTIGRVVELANQYNVPSSDSESSWKDRIIIEKINNLNVEVGRKIERYFFADAQELLINFLPLLEEYVVQIQSENDFTAKLAILKHIFQKYLVTLHPFAPFITEELYENLYNSSIN